MRTKWCVCATLHVHHGASLAECGCRQDRRNLTVVDIHILWLAHDASSRYLMFLTLKLELELAKLEMRKGRTFSTHDLFLTGGKKL